MKKLFLILIAATMTLTGFAAGTGDGSSKTNAIEFDWVNGNTQDGNTALWYRVGLKDKLNEVDNPNIALYLTNLTSSSAKVDISAVIAGDEESRTYTIGGNGSKTWNSSASMLVKMGYEEMYVKLETTQKIHLSAKVFEGTFADDACLKAEPYDEKAHSLEKGTHWYTIDVASLRAAGQGLEITYQANAATSKIVSMISSDCPSTGLSGLKGSIAKGKTKVHQISPVLIQSMPAAVSTIYLKVENSKELDVTTKKLELPKTEIDFSGWMDYDLAASAKVALAAADTKVYRKSVEELLSQKKMEPQITFNNGTGASEVKVTVEIAFDSIDRNDFKTLNVITKEETVEAGVASYMDFARNVIEAIDNVTYKYVYVRITADKAIEASARLKRSHESDACTTAQSINWNEVIYLDVQTDDADATAWYAIDLSEPKKNHQNLTVTVTNRGAEAAEVTAEAVFNCPSVAESVTRTIAAGSNLEKEIKYASYAMLDVVYVGITTTQSIKVEVVPTAGKEKDPADNACSSAVAFDWENGHKQAKGEVVWYSISTEDFNTIDFLPELIINNEGNGKLTLDGELSFECPDRYENQVRSLTIAANGTYKKVLSSEMVKKIGAAKKDDADKNVYIKLKGDQDFNFRVNKKIENEGASCAKAIPFNWIIGHNQDANETLWYAIDLKKIQDDATGKGKKVHLVIKNLTGKEATIDGMFAPECSATPQAQSITLKGNQVREKDLARSMFLAFDQVVYVRLSGTQKFHFEASIVDADPFTPITACSGATDVKVGVLTTKAGDNAWYRLKLSDVQSEEKAPRVTVINGAAAQSITASVAYECPVTEEMQSVVRSFAANQTLAKTIEQSMVNQIASKYEYVYVLIEGAKDYQFRIDMVDPNTGADCMHAVEIKNGKVNHQEAGTTKWYKINAKEYRKADYKPFKFKFSLTNTNNKAGVVNATAYTDCEGEELISGSATIGANSIRTKTVMSDVFNAVNSDWVYLKLTAAQAQDLLMEMEGRKPIEPAIEDCKDAKYFAVNTDYNQKAGEQVWYRVNIKELRENTIGDATLIVTNLTGEDATMKAEMAWECPVAYEMTEKSRVLTGNEVYNRGFSRDLLNSAEGTDIVYIRVTSDKQMKFRVNMHWNKGEDCSNPVMFDWENGNINPKGECIIYRVDLWEYNGTDSVLRIPEDYDLRLSIQNIGEEKTTISLGVGECGVNGMDQKTRQYTLGTTAEDNKLTKTVAREKIIENLSLSTMAIQLCSPNSAVRIWAEIIPNVGRDTVTVDSVFYSCDNVEFDYFVENKKDGIDTITTTVTFGENDTIRWNDLRQINDGFLMTSYKNYTFTAIKRQNVALIDHATIPDSLMLKEGDVIKEKYENLDFYLDSTYNAISSAKDSLATTKELIWFVLDTDEDGNEVCDSIMQSPFFNTPLTLDLDPIVLVYKVVTECEGDTLLDTITMHLKQCEVYDMKSLTLDWGKACAGNAYDKASVMAQIEEAGIADQVNLYFDLGEGFKLIDETELEAGKTVRFFAEAVAACDETLKDSTEVAELTVEDCSEPEHECTVFDMKKLSDTEWPRAFCAKMMYRFDSVADIIASKMTADEFIDNTITIYYDLNDGNGYQVYVGDTVRVVDGMKVYAEAEIDCGEETMTSTSNVVTIDVEVADGTDNQVTTLPLVDPYLGKTLNGWILIIDINEINRTWGLGLKDGDATEATVRWYRMLGATPDPDNDKLVKKGGYYLTEDEKLEAGSYYAVIDVIESGETGCGGTWRTITTIVSKQASVSTRKQMINGRLYIVTEDNVMYDAQGQKVQ